MFPKVIRIIISFHDLFTANHCAVYLKLIVCAQVLSHIRLCDSMDYSSPGFPIYGIFSGKNTGVGCHFPLQGMFPTQW